LLGFKKIFLKYYESNFLLGFEPEISQKLQISSINQSLLSTKYHPKEHFLQIGGQGHVKN
jgi:hypothetical protein